MADASGDRRPSDPKTLHDALFEMKERGHDEKDIEALFYNNPCYFQGKNPRFKHQPLVQKSEAWGKIIEGKMRE